MLVARLSLTFDQTDSTSTKSGIPSASSRFNCWTVRFNVYSNGGHVPCDGCSR